MEVPPNSIWVLATASGLGLCSVPFTLWKSCYYSSKDSKGPYADSHALFLVGSLLLSSLPPQSPASSTSPNHSFVFSAQRGCSSLLGFPLCTRVRQMLVGRRPGRLQGSCYLFSFSVESHCYTACCPMSANSHSVVFALVFKVFTSGGLICCQSLCHIRKCKSAYFHWNIELSDCFDII